MASLLGRQFPGNHKEVWGRGRDAVIWRDEERPVYPTGRGDQATEGYTHQQGSDAFSS
jgi:hypothetical protein